MTIKYGLLFFFELTDNDGQNFLPGIVPAKNHRWVLRIRASVTDLLSDPTLVAQLRSVESLYSKHLLESPIGFAVDI
jgi:hypothetical protein